VNGSDRARWQQVMKRVAPLLLLALLAASCDGAASGDAAGSSAASPSASGTAIPDVPSDVNPAVVLQEFPDGGPRNQVHLLNQQDGRFMARASIRLNRVNSDSVKAMNIAIAEARCIDCQTIAVALQVVLYKRGTSDVQPVNFAYALNTECKRCITVARAIQYAIPVDDPNAVPDNVSRLIADMNRELRYFSGIKSLSELDPQAAMQRLDTVVSQYNELTQYVTQLQDAKRSSDAPSPSPSTSAAPSPSATPASSPTASPSPSPTGP
jgi:hypothetical protein